MNVFEDQRFLLRTREGPGEERYLSWRDIMTGEEEVLPFFHYPLEYMNVAALGLCINLTQAFLEPERIDGLIERLDKPVPETEIDAIVEQNKHLFGIDEGNRFMQGPEPPRDKKGRIATGSLSELLLTVKKGDKEFLNRPILDWGVRLDQIPVFLASRATFYEKSAGRGYLTGTTGDLEIRTFLIDPNSLRNTIWLNVLAHERYKESYMPAGSAKGYDNWMWIKLPETKEVPQNAISLRSSLFWTVANMWIDIQKIEEPRRCIVTGDLIEVGERAGIGVVVKSTEIAFGATVKREDGQEVRQSFFLHPNAPFKTIHPKKGIPFDRHLEVEENSGLIGQMGGLFYATSGSSEQHFHLAPIVDQIYTVHDILEREYDLDMPKHYDMLCFGFHMLSSKKNVHGGYESELFAYPILGSGKEDRTEAMKMAENIINGWADSTYNVEAILRQAVQRCIMKETDVKETDGVITFTEKAKVSGTGILRDVSRELWSNAGDELREMMKRIADYTDAGESLHDHEQSLRDEWTENIVLRAERIFRRYFDDYSASPQHLLAAHDAQRLFYGRLRKMDSGIFERRQNRNGTSSNDNQENADE